MYELQVDHSYGEKIENFNNTYSVHNLLKGAGWIEDIDAGRFEYLDGFLYSRYSMNNKALNLNIVINKATGLIDIRLSNGFALDNSFDCYVYFYHDGDPSKALNWEFDPRINRVQPQVQLQPFQNKQHQEWSHQQQSQPFQRYPKPSLDIDFLLDNSIPKNYLNLSSHLYDKDSLVFQLPAYLSHKTDIPISTMILLTLSVWSGMTSKCYQCAYKDGRVVSIGIYAVLEQNSGAGKSPALEMLLEPLSNMIKPKISEIKVSIQIYEDILDELNESLAGCTTKKDKADNKQLITEAKNFIKKINKNLNRLQNMMPITNATPEALEAMLIATMGFFFAASAENGLFNSVLGLRYGSKYNNNDLLLNSREGGYVNSSRVGRKGYSGHVTGVITSFAQDGGISNLLSASGNTGLGERFLMASEPTSIGFRDRISEKINGDHILKKYASKCGFFQKYIDDENALNRDSLITLKLTDNGWRHIANFEQDLEDKMRHGGELSHPILQRVVGKTKMQVMGIATNLYLLHTDNPPVSELDDPFVPNEFVVMAISIFNELIVGVRSYCERKGLISDVAQLSTVYHAFIGKGDNVSYTDHELKKRLQQVKPFKDILEESPRKVIQKAIDHLIQHNVLLKDNNGKYFKNPEKFDRTYQ